MSDTNRYPRLWAALEDLTRAIEDFKEMASYRGVERVPAPGGNKIVPLPFNWVERLFLRDHTKRWREACSHPLIDLDNRLKLHSRCGVCKRRIRIIID